MTGAAIALSNLDRTIARSDTDLANPLGLVAGHPQRRGRMLPLPEGLGRFLRRRAAGRIVWHRAAAHWLPVATSGRSQSDPARSPPARAPA